MYVQSAGGAGALQAALTAECARSSALKQQLSALIAAGHADLAKRARATQDALQQTNEATVSAQSRLHAAEAALAHERCTLLPWLMRGAPRQQALHRGAHLLDLYPGRGSVRRRARHRCVHRLLCE